MQEEVDGLKNKIKKFSKGDFQLAQPQVVFPDTSLILTIGEGEVYKGYFMIKNRGEGSIRGLVYSSSFRMRCLEQGFEGNIHEVKLRIDDTDYNFARLDEIFRANPQIEGAVIFNSTCYILGNYLKERGLENVKLVGYDLIGKNTQLLSEGIITALIAQRPEQQGYDGIKSLCNYLVLKQRPDKVNLMPIDILIKENLKYYLNKKL